jgi:hypothetical protein
MFSLQGIASTTLLNCGRAGLYPIGGPTRAPIGSREPGVHDGGRACDLLCAGGPASPMSGRIRGALLHSTSEGSVCHHTNFSSLCYSSMAWNCTTRFPRGS